MGPNKQLNYLCKESITVFAFRSKVSLAFAVFYNIFACNSKYIIQKTPRQPCTFESCLRSLGFLKTIIRVIIVSPLSPPSPSLSLSLSYITIWGWCVTPWPCHLHFFFHKKRVRKQKNNYGNSFIYFTMQILQKKKTKNQKSFNSIITNLKFKHKQAKICIHFSKKNPCMKIDLLLFIT
jgi:hypothetical protein